VCCCAPPALLPSQLDKTYQAKRGRRSLLPREGAWIPNSLFSHHGALKPRGGTINRPARALAASSRSALNVTPRPAPRPRHGHTTPCIRGRAPMADVVGPTRRILAPPANERWRRRLPQTHYELESHDAPIRESAQDLHATPPAPMRGTTTRQSHDHAGQRGSATHNAKTRPGHIYTVQQGVGTIRQLPVAGTITSVGRVAPGPAAATQMKVTSMTSVPGKPTAVTPSAPVGTEQLVAVAPFLCRQLSSSRRCVGEFSRGTTPLHSTLCGIRQAPPSWV